MSNEDQDTNPDWGISPSIVLAIPAHTVEYAAYETKVDQGERGGGRYCIRSKLHVVAIGCSDDVTWKACVLNPVGKVVFADTLPGFDCIENDVMPDKWSIKEDEVPAEEFELFYDEMMEGPIEAKLTFLHPDGSANFVITDKVHVEVYGSGNNQPMLVSRARLITKESRTARRDEYVYKRKA
jgi:hypothetical protein